jgi:arsenate reductase
MKILFICTHNACRSILGEAITRHLGAGRIDAASAGTSPGKAVHPETLKHLNMHGYETRGLSSKSLESVSAFAPDIAITVCDSAAGESCPIWLGSAVKVHWGLTDPSHLDVSEQEKAEAFADLISTLERRISRLLEYPLETMNTRELNTILNQIGRAT